MSEGTSPQTEKSPLGRLVLFMVCLAIAGSFVAGIHYYAVDLPQQQDVKVPANYTCPPGRLDSCARYGDKCYECIATGEYGLGCEISAEERFAICGKPYEPKQECDSNGLCIMV
jgi:hypothetical protein